MESDGSPEGNRMAEEDHEGGAEGGSVSLPAEFLIREVDGVYADLVASLKQTQVTVDASDLVAVDTAAMQLLFGYARRASQLGVEVEWKGNMEPITEAAGLLGLADEIGG